MAQTMVGEVNSYFDYIGAGTGNDYGVTLLDNTLQVPHVRQSVQEYGWFEAYGNNIRQGGLFPPNTATATLKEFGAFDSREDPSIMWWRTVISTVDKYLVHEQNLT